MSQVFVPPENIVGSEFSLGSDEAHHLIRVLRKKPGQKISLFDGKGNQYSAELTSVDADVPSAKGRILEKLSFQNAGPEIVLFQGLPKGSKFDYVVEKNVELGVGRIVPFLSQKNLLKDIGQEKTSRWQRLAEAAAKQCQRATMPTIEKVHAFDDIKEPLRSGLSLFFLIERDAASMRDVLQKQKKSLPSQINLIIGPESGFSPLEVDALLSIGCMPVSLGARILRTETAGLVALSLVNYELGLL